MEEVVGSIPTGSTNILPDKRKAQAPLRAWAARANAERTVAKLRARASVLIVGHPAQHFRLTVGPTCDAERSAIS
jgi:hypothetical protein